MKHGIRTSDLIAIRAISCAYFAFHTLMPRKLCYWWAKKIKTIPLAVFIAPPPELPENHGQSPLLPEYRLPLPEQMLVLVDQADIHGIVFAVSGDNDVSYFSILPNNRRYLNAFSHRKWNIVCRIPYYGAVKPKLGDKVAVRGTFGIDWKSGLTHISPVNHWRYY